MKTKIFHDKSSSLSWAVRVVFEGEHYGLAGAIVHAVPEPLVEFFDTRYEHTDLGQFVSRYYLSTLLDRNDDGLCLDGGVRDWRIGGACMRRITDWLASNAS